MKHYLTPELEIKNLRAVAVLTVSDETDIISPYGDGNDADPVD